MSDPTGPYEAGYNNENRLCVRGPGAGLGYYSGTLWSGLICDTEAEAERAARIANIAYAEGAAAARTAIRKALGL